MHGQPSDDEVAAALGALAAVRARATGPDSDTSAARPQGWADYWRSRR